MHMRSFLNETPVVGRCTEAGIIAQPVPNYNPLQYPLKVGSSGLGKLEGDGPACESSVDLGVGVESVVYATTLLLVQDNLQQLAVVLLSAQTLANNLDGVDKVTQDSVVDGSQSPRAGALLLLGVARAGRSLGAGQDAARGEDQDMVVGELLLELTGKALLHTVETGQGGDGDKDDDCLLAVANLDLFQDPKLAGELQDTQRRVILGPLPVLFH
jgi:hypothetical protein